MLVKCNCNHCPAQLEFDSANAGQVITCPTCGMETTLYVPATQSEDQLNGIRDARVLEKYYASGKRLSEDQMNVIRDARGREIVRTIRALSCGALGGLGAWFLISGLFDLNSVSNDQNGTIFQQQFSMLEIIGGGLLIGIVLLARISQINFTS